MDQWAFEVPVDTSAPSGRTTAYYLRGTESVLIDPAGESRELTAAIEKHGLDHIAITHSHRDHVQGVQRYGEMFDASVWAKNGRGARFERATGISPTQYFREGTRVGPTTVITTPGHAPDHVAFSTGRAAVTGDLAVASGSVFVGRPDGDMRAYLTSLRRVNEQDFRALYPAHGPKISNPNRVLSRLISHRLDREARILRAVQEGARTPDEIVTIAYEKNLDGVRSLARRAVESHLEKLAVEDKITLNGPNVTIRK